MKKYTDTQLRILEKLQIGCRDVVRLMGDYQDQELSTTLKARIDSHIRSCDCCQEFKNSYEATVELAATLGEHEVPNDVQNRLRKSLNQKLGLNLPLVG